MVKQASPVRMAGRKSLGKQNAKNKKPRSKLDMTRQIKIQKALYEIVDAASAVTDMQAFYRRVHEIVGKLMYAGNFFIATYDEQSDLITWTYYVDTMDVKPSPIHLSDQHGATGWILRHGKTLADVDGSVAKAIKQGEIEAIGTDSDGIGVPLKSNDKMIGVLIVQSYKPDNKYTLEDIEILNFIAKHISTALTRARAIEETRERNAELQIINSVQEGLASKLDIKAIYELIGEKVRDVFNVQVVDIVNYDPIANLISMPYSYEKGDRSIITPREPYGFRKQVIDSRTPLLINQNFVEMASKYNNPLLTGEWPKSALFVPLLVDGKVKSIISIQDLDRDNAFSTSDVQLLQTLSNAMSIALENARLFEETQHLLNETEQRAQELATVNTVSAALAGELELNTLIELVGEQIRSVFKADIAFVALLDKEKGIINFPYQYGQQHIDPIQWGQGITSKIIQSGQPLVINRDMDRQVQQMGVSRIGKRARSFLGVPIFMGGEPIGVVSVQHSEQEEIFTDNDLRLLSTISTNVGIALQNAHLFHETQRALQAEQHAHEQTETLRSVAQALNRSLSLREVFDLVLTETQKVIPYDSAGIYQVQGNRRVFATGRGFKNLDDLIGVGFEFNQQDDEIGYLISKSLQPLILEDAPEQYPQYFSTGSHAATKIRSYMAVPIVLNQKLIGMITLDREEPGFYKDHHARLAMVFAAQAAIAINNASLFDETQQRNAELAIINSVQEGLASKLDMQAIYDLVGDKIRDIFDVQAVVIASYDHITETIHFNYLIQKGRRTYTEPIPFTKMTRHLIRTRQFVLINEDMENRAVEYGIHPASGTSFGKSGLWMPLMVGDEVCGVINLHNLDHEGAFSDSDVSLLQTLANSMSIALENARLWEQERMFRKALERELEIGREIQAGFLPESLPQIEGWEIAATLMSAREVAGDFYDAFEFPDGNIGLVIADVCDKGVGAALFMTLFRSLIRATANLDYFDHAGMVNAACSAEARLQRAISLTNNYITETHGKSGMFATLFFGILNPQNGKFTYINGGHEPPLIIREGVVRETLRKTGPAVGVVMDGHFELVETQISTGEMFVAFTDGIPDCRNPRGEFYGHGRLLDVLKNANGSSLGLIHAIEADLRQYIAGSNQFDDITILAVRHGV
ncbi:MAG: GAF domain-containing protein [Anaerolineales bacterium]|nr:GAF domain-containing protein [Anaerolineales bacterium]